MIDSKSSVIIYVVLGVLAVLVGIPVAVVVGLIFVKLVLPVLVLIVIIGIIFGLVSWLGDDDT